MSQRGSAFLGVLAAAAITVACGPTDAGISANVKTSLTADETVKSAQIDVGVQKKVVTLSGTVDTPAVKERAVAVARQIDGVANVIDHITIREQGSGPGRGPGREMMEEGMKMQGKESPQKKESAIRLVCRAKGSTHREEPGYPQRHVKHRVVVTNRCASKGSQS